MDVFRYYDCVEPFNGAFSINYFPIDFNVEEYFVIIKVSLRLRFYFDKISLILILLLFIFNQIPAGIERTF